MYLLTRVSTEALIAGGMTSSRGKAEVTAIPPAGVSTHCRLLPISIDQWKLLFWYLFTRR